MMTHNVIEKYQVGVKSKTKTIEVLKIYKKRNRFCFFKYIVQFAPKSNFKKNIFWDLILANLFKINYLN